MVNSCLKYNFFVNVCIFALIMKKNTFSCDIRLTVIFSSIICLHCLALSKCLLSCELLFFAGGPSFLFVHS